METTTSTTCNCLGYDIYSNSLDELPQTTKLINTINQYSYCMAEEDPEFKHALQHSDILLPDGVAIVAAAKMIRNQAIKKISGTDLHEYMLKKLNATGGKVMYLGSSNATLDKIQKRLSQEYPNLEMNFFSPPYKAEFSNEDSEEMINAVNEFKPDVLFVGMTAPKQEKWAYKFKNRLQTKTICSIGAVFDFYAGNIKRPSQIWIDLGLEWLGRLVAEPKRLYKRYVYYGPIFIYKMMAEKAKAQHTGVDVELNEHYNAAA